MTFKPITDFIKYPTKIKIQKLISAETDNELSSVNFNNPLHKVCHYITRFNQKMEVLQTSLDLDYIFQDYAINGQFNKDDFMQMPCGWYENLQYKEDSFFNHLYELMKKRKLIFTYFDLHNYILDEDKETNTHELSTHATALLFYPIKKNNYGVFYFNPHGRAIVENEDYELYISKYRKKVIKTPELVDTFVIKKLISDFTLFTGNTIQVDYDSTKYCNYYGPNLQVGDKYGICFTFPFLLFYDLCFHLTDVTYLEDKTFNTVRRFSSYSTLIKRNDFHRIILIIFSKYFTPIREEFLHNRIKLDMNRYESDVTVAQDEFNEGIEDIIERGGTLYVKLLINILISFVTQKRFKNIIHKEFK